MGHPSQRRKDLPKETDRKPKGSVQPPKKKGSSKTARHHFGTQPDLTSKVLKPGVISIPLQQLLLNVFKTALLRSDPEQDSPESSSSLSQNIQTLKTHLFRRDFASAFADASEELLRAYALRWSAGRTLGYAGIFLSVCEPLLGLGGDSSRIQAGREIRKHIVCIGGGGGAEAAALATVWRALSDKHEIQADSTADSTMVGEAALTQPLSQLSLKQGEDADLETSTKKSVKFDSDVPVPNTGDEAPSEPIVPPVSVTTVDIADWSPILKDLATSLCSESVPSLNRHARAPLLPTVSYGSHEAPFSINFEKADVLNIPESGLRRLLFPVEEKAAETALVTLMFTLNELFSTSMPKAVTFLLRLTDLLLPGTILLVVDSPGSYSTVSLGATKPADSNPDPSEAAQQSQESREKRYPMKFLLEHTLLSVATGQWECLLSDESRWFRRDEDALRYSVGDGVELEDMRYQIYIYKKLGQ